MSNPVRIFIDLDGPILDVAARHHRVYRDAVLELGGTPVTQADYWEAKRSKVSDASLLERSGLKGGERAYQALKLARIEAADYLVHDLIQDGVAPVLESLGRRHPLVLVTLRNSRQALEGQLDRLNLSRHFEAILSGKEAQREGWRIKVGLVEGRFGRPATGSWFVGDTETDILAGKHWGLRTVAVTNGIRSEPLLKETEPDYVLPSASQLLQAIDSDESSVR